MPEQRILLFALRGRDAPVMGQLLDRMGHVHVVCDSIDSLAANLGEGASMAIVTEESLSGGDRTPLDDWLGAQPPWSDFPFILLATKRIGRRPPEAQKILDALGNVVVLERPIHSDTLASAVASAFRVRRRQYEARRRLLDLQAAEERLKQLNGSLESRIAERTRELSDANNQLMQEVAERERIQSALVQSQKMEAVGQLTGGIAHDFNNLLTVISGNLELIEHRVKDSRVLRLAGFARHATSSAAKLTHQLLAFSRTQQLTLTPVDLNALVEGMNDILERTIGPQIEKKWILDPASPWVMADTNQLELAILNLAINARDAMPRGGTLSITTGIPATNAAGLREGSYATVTVADTGTGIPPHLMNKVFDPFFTTKAVGKGTGLGLSQVFGIARQSGGSAVLESEEGVGTRVGIWLPRAEAVTLAAASASKAALSRPEGRRILVIDDDDGVRRFMTDCLESLGYKVWGASDGPSGLAILKQRQPDLLLVDFAMAGMNGAEVVREAHRVQPDLPVIMATGYAEFDAADQAAGIHRILRKPFQIDDLSEALGAALAPA